jgi:hypothetical protein
MSLYLGPTEASEHFVKDNPSTSRGVLSVRGVLLMFFVFKKDFERRNCEHLLVEVSTIRLVENGCIPNTLQPFLISLSNQ